MGNFITKPGDIPPSDVPPSTRSASDARPPEDDRVPEGKIGTSQLAYRLKNLMDADPHRNDGSPCYADLVARTKHELGLTYRRLNQSSLRCRQRLIWMPESGFSLVRVPYLESHSDSVVEFPPASGIKGGYALPVRVRAFILGVDEISPDKDPFLLLHSRFDSTGRHMLPGDEGRPSVPYEDNFLLNGPWLNQTTATYFESVFMGQLPEIENEIQFMARGLFHAWREDHKENQETPNLQQMRYFANSVVLLQGEKRPSRRTIADIVATHKRICDAVAEAQDKPVSRKDEYTWVEHGAEMGVVYPSVIIVVREVLNCWQPRTDAECREILFNQCSVLLVRTGREEEHLSAPIDFSELGPAILPFDQDEIPPTHVVRVRVRDAVRFIMTPERREREHSPRLTAMKKVLDEESTREAEIFATEAVTVAEENGGIDRHKATWAEFRRARAYLENESLSEEEDLARKAEDANLGAIRRWERWT